mmetsp:Transcript_6590/g.27255  ORF Transcript_6590/g.27255 Transcript_6590/m.27255 type:complete len:288 (-) Transcript_6590:1756-2619(-)
MGRQRQGPELGDGGQAGHEGQPPGDVLGRTRHADVQHGGQGRAHQPPPVGAAQPQLQPRPPQRDVQGQPKSTAAGTGQRIARQAHAGHGQQGDGQRDDLDDDDDAQRLAAAQVGPHDAGHVGVPGVQQQRRRQGLQQATRQRLHLGRRVHQAQQRPGRQQRDAGAADAQPGAGPHHGPGDGVGLVTPAGAQGLGDGDADASANDAKQHEQRREHLVGDAERGAAEVRQPRGERGADDTDADAEQQFQQQRPGQGEKSGSAAQVRSSKAGRTARFTQVHTSSPKWPAS